MVRCERPLAPARPCNRTSTRPHSLLLLIRGEAFRTGGETSRYLSSARHSFDDEALRNTLAVLHALQLYVVEAARWRWVSSVFIDVPVEGWPAEVIGWWQPACRRVFGDQVHFNDQVLKQPFQIASILQSIKWATAAHTASGSRAWDDMLIIRPDMMLRGPLPLPCDLQAMAVPFTGRAVTRERACPNLGRHRGCPTSSCGVLADWRPAPAKKPARASDTLLWLPRQQYAAFVRVLESRIQHAPALPHDPGERSKVWYLHYGTLHNLCALMPVRVLASGVYDANTQVDHNPLYELIDRPVCGANSKCVQPNDSEAARFHASQDASKGTWWRPRATNESRYLCDAHTDARVQCLPGTACPIRNAHVRETCEKACDADPRCAAFLYNRHGDCYLRAERGSQVACDEAAKQTQLCVQRVHGRRRHV